MSASSFRFFSTRAPAKPLCAFRIVLPEWSLSRDPGATPRGHGKCITRLFLFAVFSILFATMTEPLCDFSRLRARQFPTLRRATRKWTLNCPIITVRGNHLGCSCEKTRDRSRSREDFTVEFPRRER